MNLTIKIINPDTNQLDNDYRVIVYDKETDLCVTNSFSTEPTKNEINSLIDLYLKKYVIKIGDKITLLDGFSNIVNNEDDFMGIIDIAKIERNEMIIYKK